MDSCVTAAIAHRRERRARVSAYFIRPANRGTRAKAFNDIADLYGVKNRLEVSIEHLAKIGGSSLTDERIEVTEANLDSKEIPTSYVPFRNANMLSIAVSWAEVIGANAIYIGAVAEDSSGYPDCRPEFYEAFQNGDRHRDKTRHTYRDPHADHSSFKSRDREKGNRARCTAAFDMVVLSKRGPRMRHLRFLCFAVAGI